MQYQIDVASEEAYDNGFSAGYNEAEGLYESKSSDIRLEGYNEGYSSGSEEGFSSGYRIGYEDGYKEGYLDGYFDCGDDYGIEL